jgi:hypothetical protein
MEKGHSKRRYSRIRRAAASSQGSVGDECGDTQVEAEFFQLLHRFVNSAVALDNFTAVP